MGDTQLLLAAVVEAEQVTMKISAGQKAKRQSPREALLSHAKEIVDSVAQSGNKTINPRAMRHLWKQVTESVKEDSKKVLHALFDGLKKIFSGMSREGAGATPDRNPYGNVIITPGMDGDTII